MSTDVGTYIFKNGKNLRCGFTTGMCAAAAAKAAARMLLLDEIISEISMAAEMFGGRIESDAVFSLEDVRISEDSVSCAVRKDAGDDIDVTDGMLIYAEVGRLDGEMLTGRKMQKINKTGDEGSGMINGQGMADFDEWGTKSAVTIKGGVGVGTVTKPGLDQPVGEAAINSGPRRMISESVKGVCSEAGYSGGLSVTVSVPGGEKIAEETFNPVLGIEGGISILGTTGIVEPMSISAIIETIRTEISVKSEEYDYLVIVPGNYGMSFVREKLRVSESQIVKCSNFTGRALDFLCDKGVKGVLMAGSLGKFIKLAGGIFDTHSRNSDSRIDIIIRCALRAGATVETLFELDECVTTEAAVKKLKAAGLLESTMRIVMEKAEYYVKRRCGGLIETAIVMFSNDMSVLCCTDNVENMRRKIMEEVGVKEKK